MCVWRDAVVELGLTSILLGFGARSRANYLYFARCVRSETFVAVGRNFAVLNRFVVLYASVFLDVLCTLVVLVFLLNDSILQIFSLLIVHVLKFSRGAAIYLPAGPSRHIIFSNYDVVFSNCMEGGVYSFVIFLLGCYFVTFKDTVSVPCWLLFCYV